MLAFDSAWDSAPQFHVAVDVAADPPRVVVFGEIDLATCAAFRYALHEAIESAAEAITVDLAHVTFIGSIGIRELIRAVDQIDRIDVHAPLPSVRRTVDAALGGNPRIRLS